MTVYKSLTDAALAERLQSILRHPTTWAASERNSLIREAAVRLARKRQCEHAGYSGTKHCGEMSCPNYIGKHEAVRRS